MMQELTMSKIEAGLFGRILIKVKEISETLGYKEIKVKSWKVNQANEIEFELVDGVLNEDFRVVLPNVKEK